jgi:hypothetical protein
MRAPMIQSLDVKATLPLSDAPTSQGHQMTGKHTLAERGAEFAASPTAARATQPSINKREFRNAVPPWVERVAVKPVRRQTGGIR